MAKYITRLVIVFIRVYQIIISPLFPSSCKFVPTCSEYTISAFRKYGLCKGFYLSVWRILRCNPFSAGGNDPLP